MKFDDLVKLGSKPYPFYYKGKAMLVVAAIIFAMSLTFNYFFRPFDVYAPEHKMHYFWISLIHSIMPTILFLACGYFLTLQSNNEERWTVGKEIIFISLFLLIVGIGQFFIRDLIYDNPDNWSWHYFFEEIRNTFMVGTLFVFILVPLNYNRLNSQNIRRAKDLESGNSLNKSHESSEIFVRAQVKNDDFLLCVANFVYAQSERNYVEVYLKKENGIEKLVKRITITDLNAQLADFPQIIKAHRSYLVNLNQIKEISGNAQGYRLTLRDSLDVVPVSRTMIPEFEEKLKQL